MEQESTEMVLWIDAQSVWFMFWGEEREGKWKNQTNNKKINKFSCKNYVAKRADERIKKKKPDNDNFVDLVDFAPLRTFARVETDL